MSSNERRAAAAAAEAVELLEDAGRGRLRDLGARLAERSQRLGLDREVEARGELDRAQDADRILAEADRGIADGADRAAPQIGEPLA
jgi:hypothetical protein